MATTNDDFDDCVLRLYQSVVRPGTFREYLARLGARLGGHIVALHAEDVVGHRGAIVLTVGVPIAMLTSEGAEESKKQDFWTSPESLRQ